MAGDDGGVFDLLVQEFGGRQRHIVVAGAVEAVFADAVLLVEVVGNRIQVRFRRHGHVELGVENADVRHAGQLFLTRFDAGEVGRVVQRPERNVFADDLLDALVHLHRLRDLLPAEQDAMADRHDFAEVLHDAVGRIDQLGADPLERLFVVFDRNFGLELIAVGTFVDHVRLIVAETLEKSLGQNLFVFHRIQRELHRAAAGVDYQNLHLKIQSPCQSMKQSLFFAEYNTSLGQIVGGHL